MNYKHIAIIALVLVLALVAVPVSAQQFSDYENKYVPVSAYDTANLMTYAGHVYGNVKSGHVLEGGEIFIIHRDGAPENATMTVRFTPDGLWDGYLPAGEYNITLPQGTGSAAGVYTEDAGFVGNLHPETTHISVTAGKETHFTFIGNSVPSTSSCTLKYTIIKASYCGETESHIVHHDAIPEVSEYYTVVSAAPQWECHGWYKGYCYDWDMVYDGDCKKVYGSHVYYDFKVDNQKYQFVNNGEYQSTRHAAVPAVPAWDETVIDHKGGCAYPIADIQSVVDRGVTSFLFDNRPLEGGIFDVSGSVLLAPIDDPASGIRKHVSITYNAGCGTSDKTIKAMEYGVINL